MSVSWKLAVKSVVPTVKNGFEELQESLGGILK